ncbi:MAG: hypothetical protein QGF03_08380 [SAR324 cluster bacterium]|nr:hypothetical protein [SAR324 cluster bacterium]
MPLEEQQDTDSSSVSEETDVASEEAELSSSSEGDKEQQVEPETTLMDVVEDALKSSKEEEESAPPEPPAGEVEEVDTEKLETPKTSEEEEDWSDVPFNKHPRFQSLVQEKNRLKSEAGQHREDAEQYRKITDFITTNRLSAEEAAEGFRVMSLMKNDPAKAYEVLQGHLEGLAKTTGAELSEDLQVKVDDGLLDEDAAQELSRARAQLAQERTLRESSQQSLQEQQAQAQYDHLQKTLNQWEATTRQRDPDYDLKSDELNDRVQALVAERGKPVTSEQALAIANDAYKVVTDRHLSRVPPKRSLRTATGGKIGGTPQPEPKTLEEVVERALLEGAA